MAFSFQSWGRFPKAVHTAVVPLYWRNDPPSFASIPGTVLPYAFGRSYGDVCLNDGGALIDVSFLRRFIHLDFEKGLLKCEAGLPLGEILRAIVPQGWFLPVTPGTQYVSVGGAIANDIHGKNHHRADTFGSHVTQFELLRSSGERLICSPAQNSELFCATIAGLGLTGVILWAEFKLKSIGSAWIDMEQVRFNSLDGFFALSDASDESFEYTVAWIDCLARGKALGRGLYLRGNHGGPEKGALDLPPRIQRVRAPCDMPAAFLNGMSMRLFNALFYHVPRGKMVQKRSSYERFFFHLDGIRDWNRLYGKRGLIEYQCVVPLKAAKQAIAELLKRIGVSGEGAFLSILKHFGAKESPGILSFPRPGVTLASDFPNRGEKTLRLLDALDVIVLSAGGAVYPAKDARMQPQSFQAYYPQWKGFSKFIDPQFSSSFWRRVTANA